MQCSEISERMSLHLDGLLSREQATQLQMHLAECEACGEEWEAMRSLPALLRAETMAISAPGFATRVAQRLNQREARRRRLYSSLGVLMGSVGLWGAAAVVLALLLIVLWQPLIRILLLDVLRPMADNALSIVMVLARALYSVAYELSTRPTWLLLSGYAVLALGLATLWTHVALRRRQPVPQINSKT